MKKLIVGSILFMMVCICSVFAKETYYVVQQTNFLKNKGFKLYNSEEYDELMNQMKLEKRYFRKALKLAKAEWDADETHTKQFPAYAVSPRSVMVKGKYQDEEKAQEKLAKLEESEYEKLYGSNDKKKFAYKKPDKSEEDILKEAQKEILAVEAVELFQKTYSELIKEATGKEAPVYIEHGADGNKN